MGEPAGCAKHSSKTSGWAHRLGGAAGNAPWLGEATSLVLQSLLDEHGQRPRSLAGWCQWLDSPVRQSYGLVPETAPGQVGSQVVLPDQMVMLAGLCVQVGPWGVSQSCAGP